MELGIRLIFLFPFFCQVGISTKTTKMKGEDYCEVNVHSRKLNHVLYRGRRVPSPLETALSGDLLTYKGTYVVRAVVRMQRGGSYEHPPSFWFHAF